MDKNRKVIGMGVPRNRRLQFLNQKEGSGRILTYNSKKRAEAGFKVSGFWTWDVADYLKETYGYGEWWLDDDGKRQSLNVKFEDFLEAVEIEITIKEKNA